MHEGYHSSVRYDILPFVPKANRILDVGGGTGATVRHLKERGSVKEIGVMDAVVDGFSDGLDFSSSADLNRRDAVEAFLQEHGPFDVILMLDILEHLVDPWTVVDTFVPYIATGGCIIASIPNVRHASTSVPLIFRNSWNYVDTGIRDRTHLRFFVKRTAIEMMSRPGLSIERVASSPISGRRYKIMNFLTFGLLRSFFTLQYFVVARKLP